MSFSIAFIPGFFVQILSFSFRLWALAMKTTVVSPKEYGSSFKRYFQSRLTYMVAANTHYISSVNKGHNNMYKSDFFKFLFFSKIMFGNLGVRLIHECGLYTSLYGMFPQHEAARCIPTPLGLDACSLE